MPIWTDYEVHYLKVDTDWEEYSVAERQHNIDRTGYQATYVPDDTMLVAELPKVLQRLTLKGFEVKAIVPLQGGQSTMNTVTHPQIGQAGKGLLFSLADSAGFGTSPTKGIMVVGERIFDIDKQDFDRRINESLSLVIGELQQERSNCEATLAGIVLEKDSVKEEIDACAEITSHKRSIFRRTTAPHFAHVRMGQRFYASEKDAETYRDRLLRHYEALELKRRRLKKHVERLAGDIETFSAKQR